MLSFQVYTYINVLYTYVLDLNEDTHFTLYNGAAESLNTLIGTITDYSYLPNTKMWCDATCIDVLYCITVYVCTTGNIENTYLYSSIFPLLWILLSYKLNKKKERI